MACEPEKQFELPANRTLKECMYIETACPQLCNMDHLSS